MQNKYIPNFPYLSEKRTQKFLGVMLTLLALSFFGLFAISPTISTILKLQKEISDNEFIYSQSEIKIRNLSTLRTQYSTLQNDLPVLAESMPTQPDIHILFAQIQTIAKQSNITIKKLQNFEVEVLKNNAGIAKPYYSYSFSISGSGSLESVYSFVSAIADMQRIITIDVLGINNVSNQDANSFGFNIQGTAFFKQ
ncbi:MAG: type 4a pilus biogenesis protein PilO [Candidatus Parcubacteria bacterium]|nr:type 4a pilus biogenesis protein PilO [Candidatus Parcubacteria bacterium]